MHTYPHLIHIEDNFVNNVFSDIFYRLICRMSREKELIRKYEYK